jgi:hypothetical protein
MSIELQSYSFFPSCFALLLMAEVFICRTGSMGSVIQIQ